MSEAEPIQISARTSALNQVRFDGIATVQKCGLQGMITLRGELSARDLKAGATKAGGVKMPKQGHANVKNGSGLCWMSPDELLILCPYAEVNERLSVLTAKMKSSHSLAINVSDARAIFCVSGTNTREVIAKLAPVDLSPEAFKPGMFRRSRLAQVPAAFWIEGNGDIRIICFRSVADYVFGLLKSAAQPASEVGIYQIDDTLDP